MLYFVLSNLLSTISSVSLRIFITSVRGRKSCFSAIDFLNVCLNNQARLSF